MAKIEIDFTNKLTAEMDVARKRTATILKKAVGDTTDQDIVDYIDKKHFTPR